MSPPVISRRNLLSWSVAAATGAVLVSTGACSGDDAQNGVASNDTERPLSGDEATWLSEVLFNNFAAKGMTFTYAGQLTGDDQLTMTGEFDCTTHQGHAFVRSNRAEARVTEVFWADTVVAERRPAFSELVAALGRGSFEFFARPPTPDGRELDAALAIITALASEQRDNPQLIRQTEGSRFLRTDTLRGVPVNVLRYGTRNTYWLSQADRSLLRFESNAEAGTRPRLVDVLTLAPQTIVAPDGSKVADVTALDELWEAEMAGRG